MNPGNNNNPDNKNNTQRIPRQDAQQRHDPQLSAKRPSSGDDARREGLIRQGQPIPSQIPSVPADRKAPPRVKPAGKKPDSAATKTTKTALSVVGKVFTWLLNILLTMMLIGIITGGIVGCAFALYIKNYIDPEVNISMVAATTSSNLTTSLYYTNYTDRENGIGTAVELESERLHSSENRLWVKFNQMPANLYNAFVSIEDHRFFEHKGVDWNRTISATLNFFIPFDRSHGGSTITQQLIKNMTQEDDVRIQRKVQEILRALNLEKKTSKEEILELYLNSIFLSQGCYGVQAAANTYFGKDVSELTLIECAALASIPQYPYKFDPVRNAEENMKRRDVVLKEMLKYGCISQEEFDGAYGKELVTNRKYESGDESIKSYYTDQVINDVATDLMKQYGYSWEIAINYVYSGGLKIYTCQDPEVQQKTLEYIYTNDSFFPETEEGAIPPQSSMVVMDPKTGDILGLIGGRGVKDRNRGLNRATQTQRQVGSSIKPLSLYAPAIEAGLINYASVVDDYPALFNEDEKDPEIIKGWPTNTPDRFYGYSTINFAVEKSLNTIPVKLMQQLTPQYSFNFLKNTLNLYNLVEHEELPNGKVLTDIDLSPLVLGGMTRGLSVLEMTAAYSIFANNGVYSAPRTYTKVLDSEGNIILDKEEKHVIAISEETAFIMTKMMQKVTATGTAAALTLKDKIEVAGKTGSTNDDKDRWFVGYTPYYLAGIWFGYDTPQFLGKFSKSAIQIWDSAMTFLHRNITSPKTFVQPANIVTAPYCKDSGMAPTETCKLDPRGSRVEIGYFKKGTEPTQPCDKHVLVDWCTVHQAVAGPGCPKETVKQIALLKNEDRVMPIQVDIIDAQYTWREVPTDYVYPTDVKVPFYINLLAPDTYAGQTPAGKRGMKGDGDRPVNSFCVDHNPDLTKPLSQRPTQEQTTQSPPEQEIEQD
ncbi:MAG: transglycosylase domain-containing protein [Eubacteriales bacterium]